MTKDRIITGTVFSGSSSNLGWRVNSRIETTRYLDVLSVSPSEANPNSRADYSLTCLARDLAQEDPEKLHLTARMQQFSATVSALEDCSHPNLVDMVDYHLDGLNSYFVTTRFESDRLSHWLPKGRFATQPVALWIARQITGAVCEMHTAGWAHGSISAESVRISSTGHAQLGDLLTVSRINSPVEAQSDVSAVCHLLMTLLDESQQPVDGSVQEFLSQASEGKFTAAGCLAELRQLEMTSFASFIQPRNAA